MDAVQLAQVDAIIGRMLGGELAAINALPEDLRNFAQQRYLGRARRAALAELAQIRANPVHVDPTAGLH